MYINRALLLIILMFFLLSPQLEQWILDGGSQWYRPFLAWFGVILLVIVGQRLRDRNEY